MKYSQLAGIAAAILLIIACFLPWAWYPDLQENFTGFYSRGNAYGRPGKVLLFLSILAILLFLIPRIWAKRTNFIVTAITFAFGLKSFLLFNACYNGVCPEKKAGIFLVLIAPLLMLVASMLPDIKLKPKNES